MAESRRQAIDVAFQVPQVHRLRFTEDVFSNLEDRQVLLDLLASSQACPPRVQVWLDQHVVDSRPTLVSQLADWAEQHANRLELIGTPHLVPGGETIKNDVHILERILKVMHAADLDRRSYVLVIGGGAVLDAVGFAASIAHRGIRLVRLPTTTLAQADSGIGVKNGVNLFQKKNWLGSFSVPWAVINDAGLLNTLSDRDFRCGFAEAVKVALLKDGPFFERIENSAESIVQRLPSATGPVIRRSAELHLEHITRGGDPFEMLEARPLDFGHWSAHRLEALSDFQLRHGEAVAIGVAVDAVYSSLELGLSQSATLRVLDCLRGLGFELFHPLLEDVERLFLGLEEFRQHLGGRLTLTMLNGIGDSLEVHEVVRPSMCRAIESVAEFAQSPVKR